MKKSSFDIASSNSQLEEWLTFESEYQKIFGSSVAILRNGHIDTAQSGYHDLTKTLSVNSQTLFPIGCIIKVLTSCLVLRLVEQGKLSLDSSIHEYLSFSQDEYSNISTTTKVGHILSHTSGIFGTTDYSPTNKALKPDNISQKEYIKNLHQLSPPGQLFSYANAGHTLAAFIIESITKKPWLESISNLIVGDLNGKLAKQPDTNIAAGHDWYGTDAIPKECSYSDSSHIANLAIGNLLYTDAQTLVKFGQALCLDEEIAKIDTTNILTDESLHLLRKSAWQPRYGGSSFLGLGMKAFTEECYGHRGSISGYHSFLLICPSRQLVLGFMNNSNTDILARKLMIELTSKGFDQPPFSPPEQSLRLRSINSYIGLYVAGVHKINITHKNGQLIFSMPSDAKNSTTVILTPIGKNTYAGPSPFKSLPHTRNSVCIEFIDDMKNKKIRWIRIAEYIYKRFEK